MRALLDLIYQANSCSMPLKLLRRLIFCLVAASCVSENERLNNQLQYSPVQNYYAPRGYVPAPDSYTPYTQPYSQHYSNPYSNPPQNYYPYYDYDRYYVPPSNYTASEWGRLQENKNKGTYKTSSFDKY